MRAFMEGWYMPSSMAAIMPFIGPPDLLKLALVGLRLGAPLVVAAVRLLVMDAHGPRHGRGRHKLFRQAGQHPALDDFPTDSPAVAAGAAALVVEAGVAVGDYDAVLASATAAGEQA
jgi:hypothetical protein